MISIHAAPHPMVQTNFAQAVCISNLPSKNGSSFKGRE